MPSHDPNLPTPAMMTANVQWVDGREPPAVQATAGPAVEPEDLNGDQTPPGPPPAEDTGMSTTTIAVLGLGAAFIAYRLFVK